MKIQLWSYNFHPEPIGIGPVSTTWARSMVDRGHSVQVVAAHPHYPRPVWGRRLRPYRERRFGIPVLRLPIWVGRDSARERLRQEASFAVFQMAASPFLGHADVIVSVSPCFFALGPAAITVGVRRTPWVLWLQDLLPDAAEKTGLIKPGLALTASRGYERAMYRAADEIVVISEAHRRTLLSKGVPAEKVTMITNPTTLTPPERLPIEKAESAPPRVLNIGNIGLSQGLVQLVREFESSSDLAERNVQLRFAGDGVEAPNLRSAIHTNRVHFLGIVPDSIEQELQSASLGLVSQLPRTGEFNMPSRLMNFFGFGVPVLAVVSPTSEVARVIRESGGGWVVDADDPARFPRTVANLISERSELNRRGELARAYAEKHFTPAATSAKFAQVLERTVP